MVRRRSSSRCPAGLQPLLAAALLHSLLLLTGARAQSFQYSRGWGAGKRVAEAAGARGEEPGRSRHFLTAPLLDNSVGGGGRMEARSATDDTDMQLNMALRALGHQLRRLLVLKQLLLSRGRHDVLDSLKAKQYAERSERNELEDLIDLSRAAEAVDKKA